MGSMHGNLKKNTYYIMIGILEKAIQLDTKLKLDLILVCQKQSFSFPTTQNWHVPKQFLSLPTTQNCHVPTS